MGAVDVWEDAVARSELAREEIMSWFHVVGEQKLAQEELATELGACRALLEEHGITPPETGTGLDDPRWTRQRRLQLLILDRTHRFLEEVGPLYRDLHQAGGFMS